MSTPTQPGCWEALRGPVTLIRPMRTRMAFRRRKPAPYGLRWIQCGACGRKFGNTATYVIHFRRTHQKRKRGK